MTISAIRDKSEARARYQASRDLEAELRHETEMPSPPVLWSTLAIVPAGEPVERETWFDWRGVGIGIAAALVGGVFVAGACLLLTSAVFGFNPVDLAADIRSVLP